MRKTPWLPSLPDVDERHAEEALIAAAEKLLRGAKADIPDDFVAALFAHAVPEDLMHYDPRQLAVLAAATWSLLAVRKTGTPLIRLGTPVPAADPSRRTEPLRNESVLEIVNDDMPFLLDSVLASSPSVASRCASSCIPSLTVARDAAGRLVAFREAQHAPGVLRESVIYIHVERIDDEARRAEIVAALERGARRRACLR